ncbi:5514_t:CDS:2 [Gigaspora margarita]|uniref:5514_t:CDS:1 n=1 Tax=Gigaspora margarita TaxID=4874 RepID=A0ABN7UR51_GIGMA|nr:5514_t:CDS:2 [Gigaspora margarita]
MLKATYLLSDKYNNQIKYQSCTAHTLQLSVLEGLKQCKPFHYQIKSLQAFFHTPKQGQRLCAIQQKNSQQGHQLPENKHTNPLDVLTDDLLKDFFAPRKEAEEAFNTYLDLIYGSELANNNGNKTNSNSDYELLLDKDNDLSSLDNNSDNDFFKALEDNNKEFMNGTKEEDEVYHYLQKKK